MIDLTTLAKLKTADKALTKARIETVKFLPGHKKPSLSKLYQQVQVGWRIVEQILNEVDPGYIQKKWDRSRKRQEKRLERRKHEQI